MKRNYILNILITIMIMLVFCGCNKDVDINYDVSPPTIESIDYSPISNTENLPSPKEQKPIEDIIHDIIIDKNKDMYLAGDIKACGFLIFDVEDIDPLTRRMTGFVSYGEYINENGKAVKVSGSGEIPTAITFNANDPLSNYHYEEILTENNFENDVKEMFLEKDWKKVLKRNMKDMESIKNMEESEAKKLLDIK